MSKSPTIFLLDVDFVQTALLHDLSASAPSVHLFDCNKATDEGRPKQTETFDGG